MEYLKIAVIKEYRVSNSSTTKIILTFF